jgi:hypothetical protein
MQNLPLSTVFQNQFQTNFLVHLVMELQRREQRHQDVLSPSAIQPATVPTSTGVAGGSSSAHGRKDVCI